MNDAFPNASGVLKPATLAQLTVKVGRQGQLAVDGWAATNPEQVRAWEADGSLLQRAKEADDLAAKAQERADRDGMTHLAPHEINEIYGGPNPNLS